VAVSLVDAFAKPAPVWNVASLKPPAADLMSLPALSPASRNVSAFLGWLETASNAFWLMLMSVSSWAFGSWMPRTNSSALSPEGAVMARASPSARCLDLA
jgi:hypothetical protein